MRNKVSALTFTILLLAFAAFAGTPVNESRSVDPNGTVSISNIAGLIEVQGWDRAEVQVTGTLADGVEKLEFEVSGTHTKINVKYPRRSKNIEGSSITVMVPVASTVEAQGVSADITATGLRGELDLESVSGDIEVGVGPAVIDAESVSGDITLDLAPDRTELTTVSGDIVVKDVGGRIEAASVSGDVRIEGGMLDGGEFETVSGDLWVSADLGNGSLEMESMSGDLTLEVPGSISADFNVETFSGSIHNDLSGDRPSRTSKYTPGEELSFSIGSGGLRINLSTFSGSVKLIRK